MEADLWHLSVPSVPLPTPPHLAFLPLSPSAFFSAQSLPAARFVAYWHRAFGSPSLSTFRRALKRGFIRGIPHLTHHLVAKYPPLSLSTSFGHLDMLRKGISSSRPKISPSRLGPVAPTPETRRASPRLAALHDSFPPDSSRAHIVHRSEWSGADLTGRCPIPSHLGFEYILIFNHLGYTFTSSLFSPAPLPPTSLLIAWHLNSLPPSRIPSVICSLTTRLPLTSNLSFVPVSPPSTSK